MWLDRVSNPGPLTSESGALPTALSGPPPLPESEMTVSMKVAGGKWGGGGGVVYLSPHALRPDFTSQ